MAENIETPDLPEKALCEVEGALPPLSLINSEPKEIWDLTLEQAMRYALENGKVIRSIGGSVVGPTEYLTRAPEAVPTIYDPAIAETQPFLGGSAGGVEGALSSFDPKLNSSINWNKNDMPQDSPAGLTSIYPQILQQDLGSFQAVLSKTTATGGTWSLANNTNYDSENSARVFPHDWTVDYEAQVVQPLLQGAGVDFNRIAGPGSSVGNYNGVVIARINNDIALATFESSVRTMVSDVEIAYWELYFAYRNLDAVVAGRNSALQTWRRIHSLYVVSAAGGEADKEAQAREQYFLFRSSVETALNALYVTEGKLRYMMGLAATDGRLIRPTDEPTTAKVAFDWGSAHTEAMCRSVELRQQRWRLKQRDLELIAAKNYLLPRVDAVARYTWVGMGYPNLANTDTSGSQFDSAYQNLFDGHYYQWQLGLNVSMPLGFRKEMGNVRNAQLALARERVKLQEMELEVSHQLTFAIRDMEANLVLAQTNYNRRMAAQAEVRAVSAAYDTGKITLDVLLQAQRSLASDDSDYYRSLVNYNKSIAQVHFFKGSLLEYNGVFLAEGPWPGKAYFDARRRARARDAALYLNYGITRPREVSRGPYRQMSDPMPEMRLPTHAPRVAPTDAPEMVPTPAPQPAGAANSREPLRLPLAARGLPHGDLAVAPRAKPGVMAASRWADGNDQPVRRLPAQPSGEVRPAAESQDSARPMQLTGLPEVNTDRGATPGQATDATAQWKAVADPTPQDLSHERLPSSPTHEADRDASGWQGLHR
jgi:outer membrane protein TolC